MELKEDIIPKGVYCYDLIGEFDGFPKKENFKYCPYYQYLNIDGIRIPYCLFLKEGDIFRKTKEEIDKLCEKFQCTEDELWDMFPLDLLWDQCKECGIND